MCKLCVVYCQKKKLEKSDITRPHTGNWKHICWDSMRSDLASQNLWHNNKHNRLTNGH